MMGGGMFGSGLGIYGLLGFLINAAILIGIVMLVVWAVRKFAGSGSLSNAGSGDHSERQVSAREILDQRYARGDLSRDEYQQKLADIST